MATAISGWNWQQIKRDAKKHGEVSVCFEEDCPVPFRELELTARNYGLEAWIDDELGEVFVGWVDCEG